MAILRKRELNQLTPEERSKKLQELRTELVKLRTSIEAGGAVQNPSKIREIKRTIARILTFENAAKTIQVKSQ